MFTRSLTSLLATTIVLVACSSASAASPTVAVTAPDYGARVRGTVVVQGTASATPAIERVQFYNGATLWSTQAIAPAAASVSRSYSWDTTIAADGPYALRVRARNTAGQQSWSPTTDVVVDNTPPTASLAAPLGGSRVRGTIELSASGSDAYGVTSFEYRVDGTPVASPTWPEQSSKSNTVRFSTLEVADGSHTLTVVARDLAGNTTTSAPVSVTVDNTAPDMAEITAPGEGSLVAGVVSVDTSGADALGVVEASLLVDGAVSSTQTFAATSATTNTFSWDASLAGGGPHVLTVRYEDTTGNATTSLPITVYVDQTAPVAALVSPGTVVDEVVELQVNATDDTGVTKVEWLVDGVVVDTQTLGATTPLARTYDWDSRQVSNGAHTLSAVVYDSAGRSTTTVPLAVTATNATASFTSLTAGDVLGGDVPVAVAAADVDGIVFLEFKVDGSPRWTQGPSAPAASVSTTWNLDTQAIPVLAEGSHVLEIVAYDRYGERTTSSLTVTVDNTGPLAAITGPAAGSRASGTIAFSTSSSDSQGVAQVQYLVNGVSRSTTTSLPLTPLNDSWSWDSTSSPDGNYAYRSMVLDAAGNVAYSSATSFVLSNVADAVPPAGAVASLSAGAVVSGLQTLSVAATDNNALVSIEFLVDGAVVATNSNIDPGTTSATRTGSWSSLDHGNGIHLVSARLTDAAGNQFVTPGVAVTVAN